VEVQVGARFVLDLDYLDPGGVAVPLAGYTAKLQIRETYGGALILSASTADGRVALNSPTGRIHVEIPAAVTGAVTAPRAPGVYDLLLAAPAAEPDRLLYGQAVFTPGVTLWP
jgi:hypothetical protein